MTVILQACCPAPAVGRVLASLIFLFWFDFPATVKVGLSCFITLISAASSHSRGMESSPRQCHRAGRGTPTQHFSPMLAVSFVKLTVLLSPSLTVSLLDEQVEQVQERGPEISERFSCNSGFSESTVTLVLCVWPTLPRICIFWVVVSHSKWQEPWDTFWLDLQPVVCRCKGPYGCLLSPKKLLAKANPEWQPFPCCPEEIQTAAEKGFSACRRWQLLDLLQLPCCCVCLPLPSSLPTGDSNNCVKAPGLRFMHTSKQNGGTSFIS